MIYVKVPAEILGFLIYNVCACMWKYASGQAIFCKIAFYVLLAYLCWSLHLFYCQELAEVIFSTNIVLIILKLISLKQNRFLEGTQAFSNSTDLASSGVWEIVLLCKTPTFDSVCGIIFFITLLAHLFAIIVPTCWNNCQCVTKMADGIANFFLLVVTDVIATELEPLRCFNGRCFSQCGYLWPFF